jgi:hypothetical protein
VLEEFYAGMKHVGVSALTGEGMDDLFKVGGEEGRQVGWSDAHVGVGKCALAAGPGKGGGQHSWGWAWTACFR